MNELEIKTRLKELKEKQYTSIWFVLKNSQNQGAELSDININSKAQQIELVYGKQIIPLKFSDIIHIKEIY